MRATIATSLLLVVLNLVGCAAAPPVETAGWPCAVEASDECQVYRYQVAP